MHSPQECVKYEECWGIIRQLEKYSVNEQWLSTDSQVGIHTPKTLSSSQRNRHIFKEI